MLRGIRLRSRGLGLVVMMACTTLSLIQAAPAQAAVVEVRGSAAGVSANVGLFGGAASTDGPAPLVTLPPGGSGSAITDSATTRNVQIGPAQLFSSGSENVSTQGTSGAGGTVNSSVSISNINTSGQETFTASSLSSSCTASEAGRSSTATINGGLVQTNDGDPSVTGDETYVAVPNPTPPNTVIHGVLNSVGDTFDYVFNEMVLNPDGTISVSAMHEKLNGPTGFGDVYVALSICGVNPGGGRYSALTPARILDTRDGTGGIAGSLASNSTVDVQITGRGGVPASGVSAVAMNVTVTGPTAGGYLTISPAGVPRPLAANLNFAPGQTVPNLVVVKLGTGGKIRLFNSAGNTHVIFDVAGFYSDAGNGDDGRYAALVPARILDTRDGTGGGVRLGPGASLDVQVSGRGGVPATGAKAATLNVAVTGTTATSFLTVYPTGVPRPLAANLNYIAGDTVSNRVLATLGTGGKVTIYNNAGAADVIVDVGGWYSDASVPGTTGAFVSLLPARVLDTRDGTGGIGAPIAGNSSVDVQITGRGGVPSTGVSAVILNATVTGTAAQGYLTISPTGSPRPLVSDLNYAAGDTRPNLVLVRVGTGGKVNLYTSAGTHVVFDVAGYFN